MELIELWPEILICSMCLYSGCCLGWLFRDGNAKRDAQINAKAIIGQVDAYDADKLRKIIEESQKGESHIVRIK